MSTDIIEKLVTKSNNEILAKFFVQKKNVPLTEMEVENCLKLLRENVLQGKTENILYGHRVPLKEAVERISYRREPRRRSNLIGLSKYKIHRMPKSNVSLVGPPKPLPRMSKTTQIILESMNSPLSRQMEKQSLSSNKRLKTEDIRQEKHSAVETTEPYIFEPKAAFHTATAKTKSFITPTKIFTDSDQNTVKTKRYSSIKEDSISTSKDQNRFMFIDDCKTFCAPIVVTNLKRSFLFY